jgi:hypothetical protein
MTFTFNNAKYNGLNPNQCPHCHNSIEPHGVNAFMTRAEDGSGLCYSIWQCAYRDCKRIFIALYKPGPNSKAELQGFLDGTPIGPNWPPFILRLNSNFN